MIFKQWKDYMRSAKVEIFYLDFIESRYMSSDELKTLTKEKWKLVDKSVVESSHPPVETIIIEHQKAPVTAAPFKAFESNDPHRKLIEQNNYTNQSLITIGKQLDTIETKFDLLSSPVADSRLKSKVEKPIVQFQDLKTSPVLKVNSTMKKIEDMLAQLTPVKPEKGDQSGIKTLDAFAASQSDFAFILLRATLFRTFRPTLFRGELSFLIEFIFPEKLLLRVMTLSKVTGLMFPGGRDTSETILFTEIP
ncbi:hypothetical protein L3X38_001371 [Prunus dulcis]|uniref:Uncharacterized protein n=1 Tax=Prunus dulcis TaxID=3755 RepID=A0AAD4WTF4_PRUDU|nr:hypothetical protein L3X38_001371 [Prunus dulcis]